MECSNRYEESNSGINILDLPTHILFNIFENLDLRSLFILCSVCKWFYKIITDEYLNRKSISLLVTNQFSVKIQNKSLKLFSNGDKYKLNFYWKKKYYSEKVYLKSKERFRPWLHLDSNNLYVSRGSRILLFKRCANGIEQKAPCVFRGHREDVSRFAVKDGIMISGGNDGKICYWQPENKKLLFSARVRVSWSENLYIDFSKKTLVSGLSVSGVVKFWSIREDKFQFMKESQLNTRIWSVALNEEGSLCSVGSSGYYGTSPLKIFDLNREEYSISICEKFKSGAGIFDILWENENTLLTCGYDTYIREWDLRTGQCVNYWTDPFDNAVSSLASDYKWTIMSGSGIHSRIILWDKRFTSHVQVYHMTRSSTGPVYSFDFDPAFLFVSLDSSLHVLDFSKKSAVPHII